MQTEAHIRLHRPALLVQGENQPYIWNSTNILMQNASLSRLSFDVVSACTIMGFLVQVYQPLHACLQAIVVAVVPLEVMLGLFTFVEAVFLQYNQDHLLRLVAADAIFACGRFVIELLIFSVRFILCIQFLILTRSGADETDLAVLLIFTVKNAFQTLHSATTFERGFGAIRVYRNIIPARWGEELAKRCCSQFITDTEHAFSKVEHAVIKTCARFYEKIDQRLVYRYAPHLAAAIVGADRRQIFVAKQIFHVGDTVHCKDDGCITLADVDGVLLSNREELVVSSVNDYSVEVQCSTRLDNEASWSNLAFQDSTGRLGTLVLGRQLE